jgi:hypothetical protein
MAYLSLLWHLLLLLLCCGLWEPSMAQFAVCSASAFAEMTA